MFSHWDAELREGQPKIIIPHRGFRKGPGKDPLGIPTPFGQLDSIWEAAGASLWDFPPGWNPPMPHRHRKTFPLGILTLPGQTPKSTRSWEGSTNTVPNLFVKARGTLQIPDFQGLDPRSSRGLPSFRSTRGGDRAPSPTGITSWGCPQSCPHCRTSPGQRVSLAPPFPKMPRDRSRGDKPRRDPAVKARRSPEEHTCGDRSVPTQPGDPAGDAGPAPAAPSTPAEFPRLRAREGRSG